MADFVVACLAGTATVPAGHRPIEERGYMSSEQPISMGGLVFDVVHYGAKADGKTKSDEAIQRAIDNCFEAGGGAVYLPPGKYLSGPITLKSNVTLYLDAGATLLGSEVLEDYVGVRHLVYARDASNIGIAGEGTIDGSGALARQSSSRPAGWFASGT
jgi:polygalacturonase